MKFNTLKTLILLSVLSFSCSDEETPNDIILDDNLNTIIANQQPTGSSSNDLLSDDAFTSMVVEVVYVDGFEPTQTAINNFVSFLEARTLKPDGITVSKRSIPSPALSPYTNQEIANVEDANRTLYNTDDKIAVWAFFADGESASNAGNSIVLGTAYRNTSFVIYEETIQDLSGGLVGSNTSTFETTVINHEFGHILGLTNLGAPLQTPHEDTDHPKHCNEQSCLMYYKAETGSGIMDLITGGSAPTLDAQCIADLQANGGK